MPSIRDSENIGDKDTENEWVHYGKGVLFVSEGNKFELKNR